MASTEHVVSVMTAATSSAAPILVGIGLFYIVLFVLSDLAHAAATSDTCECTYADDMGMEVTEQCYNCTLAAEVGSYFTKTHPSHDD